MTIKEVEDRTGLARSNIRFYEKEKLVEPSRNERNGYRDYSEKDIETIKKIAYLRTLGISIETIGAIISEKVSLHEVLVKQNEQLQEQIADLKKAKIMCERMLKSDSISYDKLEVERYVTDINDYWKANRFVFQLDSVGFLYIWGSLITWTVLVSVCLLTGILSYAGLPPQIPVQWSGGAATSMVNKNFIFIYPAACIIIRIVLKPIIYLKIFRNNPYGEIITEYLSNYLCFIALSAEAFSILFIHGLVKNIVAVLLIDTAVLIGLLAVGIVKLYLKGKRLV